jgi:hypothetical protein
MESLHCKQVARTNNVKQDLGHLTYGNKRKETHGEVVVVTAKAASRVAKKP